MKLSRSLFAIPVVFVAAVTAAACSSSSTPSSSGDGGGGGSSSNNGGAECATLLACCNQLPASVGASTISSCKSTAAGTSSANCTSALGMLQGANLCGSSSTGSTGATGTNGTTGTTGVTNPSSSNPTTTGSNPTGSSSVGSGSSGSSAPGADGGADAGAGSCANPPTTKPIGFVPPTGIVGMGCTSAQVTEFSSCAIATPPANDAYCENAFITGAPDGQFNTCGQCAYGTLIQPGMNPPALFGMNISVAFLANTSDPSSEWGPVGWEPELGSCIYSAGGAAGQKCGLDLMAIDACSLEVCLGVCAVPNPGSGSINQADADAVAKCTQLAAKTACAEYQTAAMTDCKSLSNATMTMKGTGIYDQCVDLLLETYNEFGMPQLDAGAPTTAKGVAQFLELACGGGDAGLVPGM